jgi:adenine-specific DNA-methyltransferase
MSTTSELKGVNEKKFYDILSDLFIGAKVEGKSGYINLMKIKSKYYEKVLGALKDDVDERIREFPDFKEELFDHLYTFFKRYFDIGGSIHFVFTPVHENVWEKVYKEDDVALFWKTRRLYYVKTDKIWQSMEVEIDGYKFYFDASEIAHKKGNEKKNTIYEFEGKAKDGTIKLKVLLSERGRKTNIPEILRQTGDKKLNEQTLEKAIKRFEIQNEVDYFINKDARAFLEEQFDLWLKNYVLDQVSVFDEKRLKQLKTLKVINSSDEPLETKEVEERVNKIIKNSTRTKLFYRLNNLRAEGLIKGKFIGPGKGVWIWWKRNLFENK